MDFKRIIQETFFRKRLLRQNAIKESLTPLRMWEIDLIIGRIFLKEGFLSSKVLLGVKRNEGKM